MKISQILQGLGAYQDAFRLTGKYSLYKYYIWPGLVSFAYALMAVLLILSLYSPFAEWLKEFTSIEILLIAGATVYFLFSFVIFIFSFKWVVLTILSPMFGHLSETLEEKMKGNPAPPFTMGQFFEDLFRAARINLRNMFWELSGHALFLIVSLVPVVGAVLSPALIALNESYFTGFSLIDYTLERKRYKVRDTINFMRTHRGLAVGLGGGFMLLMFVPVIGWFAAPTLGTIAATWSVLQVLDGVEESTAKTIAAKA